MSCILEQCYNQFLSEFPDSWLPDSEDVSVLFHKNTQIDSFYEVCFIQLSKSIICGEYINVPNFVDILNRFLEKTAVEYVPPLLSSSVSENIDKLFSKYRDLNYSIYNSLKHYNYFITVSKNKFNTEESKYKYGFYKLKNAESTNNDLQLFSEITIPLCIYDYEFPIREDDFQGILINRNKLMECISEGSADRRAVLSILLHKCHFIIRKIKPTPLYYNSESDIICINPRDLDIGSYNEFVQEECNSESKAMELLYDINGMNPKLKSFVLLMKYYKQNLCNKADISKMDLVLRRFSDIYEIKKNTQSFVRPSNSIEEYDRFSLNSILNFIHNCRFSFYTQVCEPNLKQIKGELSHIENIQAKTGVINFHPYEKAIEAILRCIESHIKKDSFDDRLIDDKLEEFNRVVELYENAYEWSVSHQFFPFQLPFEESLYSNEQGDRLFVPSAYARYVDYSKLKEKLEQFKGAKLYLGFRCDLSKERKEITTIKEGIKNTDKKAIDLIAIFTASITFLFGVVNIFVVNNSLSLCQLISNTMGLGIVLALFMCIYLLISPVLIQRIDKKTFFTSGRFVFGVLGVFIYFIALISVTLNPTSQDSNKVQSEKQSIKNEVKSDTVIHSYNSVIKSNK